MIRRFSLGEVDEVERKRRTIFLVFLFWFACNSRTLARFATLDNRSSRNCLLEISYEEKKKKRRLQPSVQVASVRIHPTSSFSQEFSSSFSLYNSEGCAFIKLLNSPDSAG